MAQTVQTAAPQPAELAQQTASIEACCGIRRSVSVVMVRSNERRVVDVCGIVAMREALGLLGTHLIPPPTEPPNLQRVIDLTSPPTQPPPPMKSPKLQGDSVQMWGIRVNLRRRAETMTRLLETSRHAADAGTRGTPLSPVPARFNSFETLRSLDGLVSLSASLVSFSSEHGHQPFSLSRRAWGRRLGR